MPEIRVTKRSSTVGDTNDTFVLATAIPDSDRPVLVHGNLTRVSAYDGNLTLCQRPRGSAGAWKAVAYTNPATGLIATAVFGAADAQFRLDATGMELALVGAARTVGSMTLDLTDNPEA